MLKTKQPILIVSAILEKRDGKETFVLIQTRYKPAVSPLYSGLLEIPAGIVEAYENVYDALKREIEEETGLKLMKVLGNPPEATTQNRPSETNFVFQPFLCQQTLKTEGGLPWVGLVFRCEVSGVLKAQSAETRNPRWLSLSQLKQLIENKPETIFPLQYPVLKYYLDIFFK